MRVIAGKTAVVTGGGSGIGRGISVALARQGAQVVVADIEEAPAAETVNHIERFGGTAWAVRTDVASLDSVRALAEAARAKFGHVSIVCNNAGVSYPCRGINATHEDWTWMIGVNLWGVIHGIEAFLPAMVSSGEEAHVVNTASMNGLFPSAYSPMYSASKYGVVGLTDVLRNELQDTNVGISVLCPGGVKTRIMEADRNRPESLRRPVALPPHTRSSAFDLSPPLDPEDVGDLVLRGILQNQFYIFTDMKVKAHIDQHHDRMIKDFEHLAEWQNSRGDEPKVD
jgi:NAD(P)-dependent dehydrogenase (short-subunit alcohol dehydrogenase family)